MTAVREETSPDVVAHEITIQREGSMRRSVCSCGSYASSWVDDDWDARGRSRAHVRAGEKRNRKILRDRRAGR